MNEIQHLTNALEAALLHINFINQESEAIKQALIDQVKINEATLKILTKHHQVIEVLLDE